MIWRSVRKDITRQNIERARRIGTWRGVDIENVHGSDEDEREEHEAN